MSKATEQKINECYGHISPYLKDKECLKELRKMCDSCEKYCGDEHDYSECKDSQCFKFYLAYEYLEWNASFGG
jgi:hypothetical protein